MCDFFLIFCLEFRTNSMYFETIVVLCFLWTRDCMGVVIDSQFSFVGWQDHSIVALLPTVYTQSPEGSLSTSILCASRCFQTSHCHVYYVCRYGRHQVIVDYIYIYLYIVFSYVFYQCFFVTMLLFFSICLSSWKYSVFLCSGWILFVCGFGLGYFQGLFHISFFYTNESLTSH